VKLILSLMAALLLAPLAAACSGGDGNGDEAFRRVLSGMALQITDVPAGMQSLGSAFSTNEDAASGLGGGPTKEQLDAWGRILGYKSDFQATEPSAESSITAVSTSVSIYKTAAGAADSFTDRVNSARNADWANSHSDLTEFQQEEITRDLGADDMLWLHFSGFKETGPGERRLVTDDQIVFRIDRAWGFVGAVSTAAQGVEDRAFMLTQLEVLARKQIQHMRDGLKSEALE